MPRDPHLSLYAHVECDFMRDFDFLELPVGARFLYLQLWCYGLSQKRERFPLPKPHSLATLAGLQRHPVATYTRLLHDRYITLHDDGTVTMIGLMKKHPKIKFKEYGENSGEVHENSHGTLRTEQNRTEQNTPLAPLLGDSPAPKKRTKPDGPPCPYFEIITSYRTYAPYLKPFDDDALTDELKTTIRRIWARHTSITWFEDYFIRCSRSNFLCGRVKEFKASLPWILGPKNMTKVLGGNYDDSSTVQSDEGEVM